MKIAAISRIRNEEHIIKDTLDHLQSLGINDVYLYDDCSTDATTDICQAHPIVKDIIFGTEWADNSHTRDVSEGIDRFKPYVKSLECNPDYVLCFDADERYDFTGIDFTYDYYRLRLFDFYATEEDKDKSWKERTWMGPEYRDITMLFKPTPNLGFSQREPRGVGGKGLAAGYCKHYSKAFTNDIWEADCQYYVDYFPRWAKKWENRKGKFIHTKSDFGRPLIKWEDRDNKDKIVRI